MMMVMVQNFSMCDLLYNWKFCNLFAFHLWWLYQMEFPICLCNKVFYLRNKDPFMTLFPTLPFYAFYSFIVETEIYTFFFCWSVPGTCYEIALLQKKNKKELISHRTWILNILVYAFTPFTRTLNFKCLNGLLICVNHRDPPKCNRQIHFSYFRINVGYCAFIVFVFVIFVPPHSFLQNVINIIPHFPSVNAQLD